MGGSALAQLSDGQRACLRLVIQHMSSKDIARELNISPHTVDQRLKLAMHSLGARSRVEAAKLLAAHELSDPYQPLIHQSPDIAAPPLPDDASEALGCGEPSHIPAHVGVDQATARSVYGVSSDQPQARNMWPFPLAEGDVNTLTVTERLGWIVVIAIGSALAFGMILAGLDALSRLI